MIGGGEPEDGDVPDFVHPEKDTRDATNPLRQKRWATYVHGTLEDASKTGVWNMRPEDLNAELGVLRDKSLEELGAMLVQSRNENWRANQAHYYVLSEAYLYKLREQNFGNIADDSQ